MNDKCTPLREAKRRATQAAIFTEAARMVAESGFDNVTVEDICAEVGISKRTFFNYVDSKEQAIVGEPPAPLSEEEISEFLDIEHDDLLAALSCLAATKFRTEFSNQDPEKAGAVLRLRKEILSQNPRLAFERMSHTHQLNRSLIATVGTYFERYPDSRRLTGDVVIEAETVVAVVITSLQLGMHQWIASGEHSIDSLTIACSTALENIKDLLK